MKHELYNDGIMAINADAPLPGQRTLIVLGAPRGGTSMVAGTFAKLGVFMGDKLKPVTFEDSPLLKVIHNKQSDTVRQILEERNAQHDIWGWKQPDTFHFFFDHIVQYVRNPLFFVIVRDVVAIANRNRISALWDATSSMFDNLKMYETILTRVSNSGHPSYFISYEKALLNTDTYLRFLAGFAPNPTPEQMDSALAFVQPSPVSYLETARLTDAIGFVDKIKKRQVAGWAFFPKHPMIPAQPNLYVNDQLIANTKATIFRQDLLEKELHPSGECGFNFELDASQELVEGDKVQIRVAGDTKFLGRGTYFFHPPDENK